MIIQLNVDGVDYNIDLNFSIEKTKMLLYNYKMKRYIVNRKNINRKRSNDGIKRKRTNNGNDCTPFKYHYACR